MSEFCTGSATGNFVFLKTNNTEPKPQVMDTFFLSHGSPMLSVDTPAPARTFLQSWREKVLPGVPKAILIMSGHWETSVPTVNSVDGPCATIYDYGDFVFPEETYRIKYPASGAPDVAKRVQELLKKAGFGLVTKDTTRGLDHGVWVPLMLMYPDASIPVCQLSVQSQMDGSYHYNLGKALAPLREEGVLIIGSGGATHNLSTIGPNGGPVPNWALEFDTWLKESLINGRHEDVNQYQDKGPCAKKAQPTPEHFLPLHFALGAVGEKAKAELIHHSWGRTSMSRASYRFKTV